MDTEVGALPSAMMSSPLANVRLGTIMFKSAHSSVALNSRSSERRLMNTWAQIDTMIRYMIIKSGLRRWDTPALVEARGDRTGCKCYTATFVPLKAHDAWARLWSLAES